MCDVIVMLAVPLNIQGPNKKVFHLKVTVYCVCVCGAVFNAGGKLQLMGLRSRLPNHGFKP